MNVLRILGRASIETKNASSAAHTPDGAVGDPIGQCFVSGTTCKPVYSTNGTVLQPSYDSLFLTCTSSSGIPTCNT